MLPPLVFAPGWVQAGASVGYPLKIGDGERTTWPHGLFGCCLNSDIGIDCCIAHFCCAQCVWSEAMKIGGFHEAESVATARIVGGVLQSNEFSSGLGDATQAAASLKGASIRQKMAIRYYGLQKAESVVFSNFAHCCCQPCALCQEVDAVMVWHKETKGVPMHYGRFPSCISFRTEPGGKGDRIPVPDAQSIVRV